MNPIPWPWRAGPRGERGEEGNSGRPAEHRIVPLSLASNVRKFWERALIMEDEKWCVREDLVQ